MNSPPYGGNSDTENQDEFPHIRGNSDPIIRADILQARGQMEHGCTEFWR